MAESYATRYDRAPLMVYWEVTRACDLACGHCRAAAVAWRHPQELSTEEGFGLLEALRGFGEPKPHLVFTGGDPLKRPDVYALAARAAAAGLQVGITPSGTPLLTQEAVARLQASGIKTIALSIDGSSPERHDRIRGVVGSFERTAAAAHWVKEAGLALQINSLVCAETAGDLPRVYQLVLDLAADRWSVFFLVPVGRGAVLREVSPWKCEVILVWLYERALEGRVTIKTTEAHHFRRIGLEQQVTTGDQSGGAWAHGRMGDPAAPQDAQSVRTSARPHAHAAIGPSLGIRDGAGIMFISHIGEVYPSGFLPLSVGNVRTEDPVRLYREAPLFVQLRDPSQLKGKCGRCELRVICGGSRSRAWAATGDPLESDLLCVYQPRPQPLPVHGAVGG